MNETIVDAEPGDSIKYGLDYYYFMNFIEKKNLGLFGKVINP